VGRLVRLQGIFISFEQFVVDVIGDAGALRPRVAAPWSPGKITARLTAGII
jgi:hypothetical protein